MGAGVPRDYASFVATYEHPLRTACAEITGNDRLADALRLDLLATVALRWRLRFGARHRSRAALRVLNRLLRREVRSYRLIPPPPGVAPRTQLSFVDTTNDSSVDRPLATQAWRRAGQLRRQGLVGVTVAAVAIALLAVAGPRSSAGPTPAPPPEPEIPAGVVVLPDFTVLGSLPMANTVLPTLLNPTVTDAPPVRALALARAKSGPLLVYGVDGKARALNDALLAPARLAATSLAPTGERAVLLSGAALVVVDLLGGTTHSIVLPTSTQSFVWRDQHTLLAATYGGTFDVDLETGTTTAVEGVSGTDVVSPEGRRDAPLTELLAVTSTTGQSSRIRRWRSTPSANQRDVEDRPTFGPPWIGVWTGPGWSSSMLFVRGCASGVITLPARFGRPRGAIAALNVNGIHAGTLVAVNDLTLAPLGFLQPQTVLVAATSPSGTRLLAWTPSTGGLARVSSAETPLDVAVADLLPPA
jgi:hypothetical protein